MDYARSLFKSLVAGQNVNLDDKQKNTVPQLKSADGGNYMTMSGHGQIMMVHQAIHIKCYSMFQEEAMRVLKERVHVLKCL